jgi:hypothetical protein
MSKEKKKKLGNIQTWEELTGKVEEVNTLPWSERVAAISINPEMANRNDVAKIASELLAEWNTLPDKGLVEALEEIAQDLNSPAIHEPTVERERLAWIKAWKRLVTIAVKALSKYKGVV